MQNSQASDPTVAKLLEVDADLAVQEVELTLQLQSIQEKRHSLKNVISLFPPVDTATRTPVTTPTPVVEDVADITEAATPKLDGSVARIFNDKRAASFTFVYTVIPKIDSTNLT